MPTSVVSDDEDEDDDVPLSTTASPTTFWSRLTTQLRRPTATMTTPSPTARITDFFLNGPRASTTTSHGPTPTVILVDLIQIMWIE